jgi:hypothetical protein
VARARAGFPTERWTLTRVAHVVQQRFGVHYHPHYLAEPLHRLGFTPQRPPTQAKERDDALVEAWVRHDWEAVKKGLVEAGQPLSSWMRQVTRFGPASPPPGPPAPMHPSSNDATGDAR